MGVSPPNCDLTRLSDRRDSCVALACSLFILDKGKPVVRPGRKVKGWRIVFAGSLTAERVIKDHIGSEGERFVITNTGIRKVSHRPASTQCSRRYHRTDPKTVVNSGWLP